MLLSSLLVDILSMKSWKYNLSSDSCIHNSSGLNMNNHGKDIYFISVGWSIIEPNHMAILQY